MSIHDYASALLDEFVRTCLDNDSRRTVAFTSLPSRKSRRCLPRSSTQFGHVETECILYETYSDRRWWHYFVIILLDTSCVNNPANESHAAPKDDSAKISRTTYRWSSLILSFELPMSSVEALLKRWLIWSFDAIYYLAQTNEIEKLHYRNYIEMMPPEIKK